MRKTMRGRVLVVDDDAPVRKALLRLIRAAGYDVEALEDAAAYLAREPTEALACLVLDIRMPGMSGLDLLHAIDGTSRALPIVFITGHGDEEVRSQALAAGAVEVLYKPLDDVALLSAIERAFSLSGRKS
jgi:FixJ family two-component response regulator